MPIGPDIVAKIVAEMRLPSLAIYGGDWMRDAISSCSLQAQGLWFRLMLVMHDAKPYGHLVGANGEPLSERQVVRLVGCSAAELVRVRKELECAGVPGRTGDAKYAAIFSGEINGEEIDLSPLRIDRDSVIYSRRMVRDQRLRVLRKLVTIFGRPKRGSLTGQNADTRAGGRADNEKDFGVIDTTELRGGEGSGEGRQLSGSQLAVHEIEMALERHTVGFELPDPRRIAKWISTFGSPLILETIAAEGGRSNLDHKSANYLHQILESRKRRPHAITAGNRDKGNGESEHVHRSRPGGESPADAARKAAVRAELAELGRHQRNAADILAARDLHPMPESSTTGDVPVPKV